MLGVGDAVRTQRRESTVTCSQQKQERGESGRRNRIYARGSGRRQCNSKSSVNEGINPLVLEGRVGPVRDKKAPEMGSSFIIIRCARAGNHITGPCESRTHRPLGITNRTWPRIGMEQEEPPSHLLGLSVGSGQSCGQESPHGGDCRCQFLGTQSREEKDEKMRTGEDDGETEREDSLAQTRLRAVVTVWETGRD